MNKLMTILLLVISTCFIGCENPNATHSNGWSQRALAQVEMQNNPDPDDEFFAQYEQNFIANEILYYGPDLESNQFDNFYAQHDAEHNLSSIDLEE